MELAGQYEYHGNTDRGNGSDKFWRLEKLYSGMYEASWGKCGKDSLGFKEYTTQEATKMVAKKLKKGYELVYPLGN